MSIYFTYKWRDSGSFSSACSRNQWSTIAGLFPRNSGFDAEAAGRRQSFPTEPLPKLRVSSLEGGLGLVEGIGNAVVGWRDRSAWPGFPRRPRLPRAHPRRTQMALVN